MVIAPGYFKRKFYAMLIGGVLIWANHAKAQTTTRDTLAAKKFDFAASKRVNKLDLLDKKEGIDWILLPRAGYDRLTGLSFGIIGSVFSNGKLNDSLFYYSDHRARLDYELGGSYKPGQQGLIGGDNELSMRLDMPYIASSRYRIVAALDLVHNPYRSYYGLKQGSIEPSTVFNQWSSSETSIGLQVERAMFGAQLFPFVGAGYEQLKSSADIGSALAGDASNIRVRGIGQTQYTVWRAGIRYDTRDHPDDPSSGISSELNVQASYNHLGASGNFQQAFFHLNYYRSLDHAQPTGWLDTTSKHLFNFKKSRHTVIAARYGLGWTSANAPFFAYQRYWTSDGTIDVLGGDNTLRGFPEARFVGQLVQFANLELRLTLLGISYGRREEHRDYCQLGIVPFVDWGGTLSGGYTESNDITTHWSGGLGARAIVNGGFVIRLDAAVSRSETYVIFAASQNF